jgi:hypothetical protein
MNLQDEMIQSLEKLLSKEKLETARLNLIIAERDQTIRQRENTIRLQDKQIESLTAESKAAFECITNYDKIHAKVSAQVANNNLITN